MCFANLHSKYCLRKNKTPNASYLIILPFDVFLSFVFFFCIYLEYEMSLLPLYMDYVSILIDPTVIDLLPSFRFGSLRSWVRPNAPPPDAALLATPDATLLATAEGGAVLPALECPHKFF